MNARKRFFKAQMAAIIFYLYLFIGAILIFSSSSPLRQWIVAIGAVIALILALYHLRICMEFNEGVDFYKDYDELQMKKQEVEKEWEHVKEVTRIIGEHEALKLWNDKQQKDTEQETESTQQL